MQQIGGEHPVKSLGVLEHGQGISPSILNHVIVDYFFQSLDLELIIFCTSDLNKASSVHAFVCVFPFLLQGVQSSHSEAQNSQEVLSLPDV